MDLEDSQEIKQLKQSFNLSYSKTINSLFEEIEKERKLRLKKILWCKIAAFSLLGLNIILLSVFNATPTQSVFSGSIGVYPGVFCIVGFFSLITFIDSTYRKYVKKRIMPVLISCFGHFEYFSERTIPDSVLKKSKLIPDYKYVHKGDDYIRGKYKDVRIIISEESIKDREDSFLYQDKPTIYFSGVFALIEMNKNMTGQTVIVPQFYPVFDGNNLQKVSLEDIEFNQIWDVYGEDQVESRYILTTAFMERLKHLRKIFRSMPISCSFFDNKLLIAVSIRTDIDLFEFSSLYTPVTDMRGVEATFNQIVAFLRIIDQLKMDQKIGM